MSNSTGPRTPEGKAASARNSLKHGLTAKTTVLPGESHEQFEAIESDFHTQYQPVGPLEQVMVSEIVANFWRLRRARASEADMLDAEGPAVFTSNREAKAFERLQRYLGSIERQFHRSITRLLQLQSERRKAAKAPTLSTTSPSHQFVSSPTTITPVNGVSDLRHGVLNSDFGVAKTG